MKTYRRLLNIRWQQRITNVEVRDRLGISRSIMKMVVERKMRIFGHICRMPNNRLVKKVMEGRMRGANRKGRPRREWMDDLTDWTGKDKTELIRIAMDRDLWRRATVQAADTNGQWPMEPNE